MRGVLCAVDFGSEEAASHYQEGLQQIQDPEERWRKSQEVLLCVLHSSACLLVCPVPLSVCLYGGLMTCLSCSLFIYLSIFMSTCPSTCRSINVCVSLCLPAFLSF